MKTTLLAILAIAAALAPARLPAQGTVWLNNYDSGMGMYRWTFLDPAPAGTFFEVLAGYSANTMVPLVTSTGVGPIFTLLPSGVNARGPGSGSYFDVGYGVVPGVPAHGSAFFQILEWTGAATWASASGSRGESLLWSQAVGTADVPGPPGPPTVPALLSIPGPIIFERPEPSTTALMALGLAGWLAFRRRHRGNPG